MFASTSLLALSMSNNLGGLTAERAIEIARRKRLAENITSENLENEYQFRKKQMEDIQAVFVSIRAVITPLAKSENILAPIYQELNQSLFQFEKSLTSEAGQAEKKSTLALETAQKLEETVRSSINPTIPLEEKNKNITEFRNYARNAKYSEGTKMAIGAAIGAIAMTALFVGLIVPLAGAAILGAGAFMIGLVALKALAVICLSATLGVRIAGDFSKNQNDGRGKDVSSNLKSLVNERSRLFAGTTPMPEKNMAAMPLLKTPGR